MHFSKERAYVLGKLGLNPKTQNAAKRSKESQKIMETKKQIQE
jgi:hypothetical protein